MEKTTLGTKEEIKTMLDASKDHVFKGSKLKYKKSDDIFKYKGAHTKSGLEQLIKENGGGKYTLRDLKINPATGVYECRPEIYFKDGRIAIKDGNRGICTFFPDNWSHEQIIKEVEYAANNIIGKYDKVQNAFIGKTIEGNIRIVMQYREYIKDGKIIKIITSYYPIYE